MKTERYERMNEMTVWHNFVGKEARVISGPLEGFSGILQDAKGDILVLSYLDKTKTPRTLSVKAEYVEIRQAKG